ncbi:MAG: hypothetical protein RLZZ69_2420, partial [Cyanobacteriota bacterium]
MPRKKTKSTQSTNRPLKTVSFLEKSQVGISLTSQAVENLNEIVEFTGLSKSGVIEGLVTGNLAIASQIAKKTISIESDSQDNPENITTKIQVVDGAVPKENQPEIAKSSKSSQGEEQGQSTALIELKEKIKEHKANYQALKKYAQEQEALVKKLIKQVESQTDLESNEDRQKIEQLEAQLNQELEQLKQQLADREIGQKTTAESLANSEAKIQELERQLSTQQNSDNTLQNQLAEKEAALAQLQHQLDEKQSEVDSLNQVQSQLAD